MKSSSEPKIDLAKVLLVDDKYPNLVALEAVLEQENTEFYFANSGEVALKLAMRHEFALMLIDVHMPEMDGFELANIFKSHKKTKSIPIIFVTAHRFDADDVIQGYTEGAIDYLIKPLNVDITRAKVGAFIEMYYQKKHVEQMNLQLDEANKKLSETNQALEEFANIVAHDLKEPLRTISSFLRLLHARNRNTLDGESLEFMKLCTDSAARLDNLVKSLIQYARTGYKNLEKEVVDLSSIVDEVKENLYVKIEETNTIIEINSELPKINANQLQISQLFQNLIDNAIKYQVKEKQPLIRLDCVQKNGHWQIAVKDNGIGIPEGDKDKVFGIFHRCYTHQKKYNGSGVGLAICKKIVENNSGTIDFESKVGEGTTFYLTFPRS